MRKVIFRGQEVEVYEGRFWEERLPNKFYYDMRHGDSDWSMPITIEKWVCVNYWGLLITDTPLDLGSEDCLELTVEEGELFSGVEAII